MTTFTIGKAEQGAVKIDLARLVDTRMLIQANSGGGKSWLLRLMCERTAGKVQTIVLDPEGEFATLREKVDMALVGQGGELATDLRSAALLARKLCEVGISAIVDLYDLKLHERREFVKRFLEALMTVRRDLWHPLLVVLDEAHVFAPERAAGESVATEAVITMMSQGRKRGFAGILSTQRLSKLHKDAAAESNNVVIGRTWLDVDQQRAGDLLGMNKADRQALRDLDPGEFFAFGPALSGHGVVRFRSDEVETTHPKAGQRHLLQAPRASEKIREVVAQIGDLPKQADEEVRTIEAMQKEIHRLKREMMARSAPTRPVQTAQAVPKIETIVERVEVPIFRDGEVKALEAVSDQLVGVGNQLIGVSRAITEAVQAATKIRPSARVIRPSSPTLLPNREKGVALTPTPLLPHSQTARTGEGERLPRAERAILTVLTQYPDGRTLNQVAILSGYAIGTGGFNNAIGALRSRRYIHGGREHLQITDDGLDALGPVEPLPAGQDLIDYWRRKLSKAERAAFDVLIEIYPAEIERDALAERAGYAPGTGGINNAMSRLCTLELAVRDGKRLRANGTLFE